MPIGKIAVRPRFLHRDDDGDGTRPRDRSRLRFIPRVIPRATALSFALMGVLGARLAMGQSPPPLPDLPDPGASASAPSLTPPAASSFTPPAPSASAPPSAAPSVSVAKPPASSSSAPPPPPPTPPPAKDAPDPREADAHADRVMVLPTAYTHPAGTLFLTSYDIVLLQAGYAVSDHTQISVTATPPFGQGKATVFPLDISLKTVLIRERLVRVAAIGSATGIVGLEEGNVIVGRIGGVVQLCLEDTCASHLDMASTFLLAGPATLGVTGVGLVWRFANWGALLFEVDTLTPLSRQAGQANGIAILPGLRFPHRTWSLDLGFVRPLGLSGNVVTIPLLSFTYRFL